MGGRVSWHVGQSKNCLGGKMKESKIGSLHKFVNPDLEFLCHSDMQCYTTDLFGTIDG